MPSGAKVPLVYLDTSVWLLSIAGQDGHAVTDSILLAAAEGRIDVLASWLVRAEVQTAAAPSVPDDVKEAVAALLDNEGVRWVAVDRFVAQDAVALSQALPKPLAGADAVHLATAVRHQCDYLMALDGKFPFGDQVKGVQVMKPAPVWAVDLLDLARDLK